MTGEEVVERITKDCISQSEDRALGYWLVTMSTGDVEQYFPEELKKRFDKLSPGKQKEFCSWVMDQMAEMFEESPEYGFRELFEATLDVLTDEEISEEMKEEEE